jgi:hypothetical protein
MVIPILCGIGVTLGCGGAKLWKRIVAAAISGGLIGILSTVAVAIINRGRAPVSDLVILCAMHTFVSAVLATIGAILTELILPDPDLNRCRV